MLNAADAQRHAYTCCLQHRTCVEVIFLHQHGIDVFRRIGQMLA